MTRVALGQSRPGKGVGRIALERLLEETHAGLQPALVALVPLMAAAKVEVIGLEVDRRPAWHGRPGEAGPQGPHCVAGDLVLEREDVIALTVELLRPQVRAVGDLDQLHRDPQPFLGPAHRALQHFGNAQLAAQGGQIVAPRNPGTP